MKFFKFRNIKLSLNFSGNKKTRKTQRVGEGKRDRGICKKERRDTSNETFERRAKV